MSKFAEFYRAANKSKEPPPKVLVALDPGETTGYAIFKDCMLVESGQLPTHNVVPSGVDLIQALFEKHSPNLVVYEDYKVYAWKTDTHAWNTLHTPRLIGAIQALCHLRAIPTFHQMAQQPKGFCTDQKLRLWDFYTTQKHARDAIRHGTFYLLFNQAKPSQDAV